MTFDLIVLTRLLHESVFTVIGDFSFAFILFLLFSFFSSQGHRRVHCHFGPVLA
jgi:hypothetical protein